MGEIATIAPRTALQTSEQTHFDLMQRKAALFAASPLIPEALRAGGSQQALANCYIGLTMAEAMGENPLTVLQNIHVVKGKAGFSAQFMIARANASGVFKGRIDWRITGKGDTLSVTAFAIVADTGQEVSVTVDMAMAKAEGWTANSKYKSMPEVMMRYRSATFLVRFYCPDVMFGYQTAEEVEDVAFAAAPISLAATPLTGAALLEQAAPAVVESETIRHDAETGEVARDAFGLAPAKQDDAAEPDPRLEKLYEIKDALNTAPTLADLDAVVAREKVHAESMTDEQQTELSEAYATRAAELAAA